MMVDIQQDPQAQPLRICMLAPSHPSWDPRVVMRESRTLAKQGHRVAVLAMHDAAREFPPELELLPIPYRQRTRWQRIKLMLHAYRLARKWPADVYHAHEVESLLVGILLKWRTGAKLIFDSHECFYGTAARFLHGSLASLVTALTKHLLRVLARRADHVIVVSYTNRAFYREFCRCPQVTIIHNSPLPELFPCLDKTPDALRTFTHNSFLDESRGLRQVLEAIALVKREVPVRFLNVGMIAERDREAYERHVRELGLEGDVECTGWLDYERVGVELNRGAIGLLALQPTPNTYGTLHNKLFNCMCAGQAIIGPLGSDTEKVIRQAQCGLVVDMTDPRVLADAMLSLLHNADRLREYGANARRAIETEFGWHIMEQELESIYATLGR